MLALRGRRQHSREAAGSNHELSEAQDAKRARIEREIGAIEVETEPGSEH
jgi:hypothetical protein